jgi:hypothetical protein
MKKTRVGDLECEAVETQALLLRRAQSHLISSIQTHPIGTEDVNPTEHHGMQMTLHFLILFVVEGSIFEESE